jgi:prepilin signal peptidase PulO-like enzyme (type II secretory pathway)
MVKMIFSMEFTALFTILGFLFGTSLGSFLKAMADRSLSKDSFVTRSECPHCKHKLGFFDLFPILSYLIMRGKCRYCHKKIGREYLIVELISGVVLAYLFYRYAIFFPKTVDYYQYFVFWFDLFFKTFILVVLGSIIITDIKKMLIPDRIILPSIVIAFFALVGISIIKIVYLYYFMSQTALGRYLLPPHSDYFYRHAFDTTWPLFGGLLMGFLIGLMFFLLIVATKGRGMGGGDFKLGIFIGLVFGFPEAITAIMLGFFTGAVFGIAMLLLGKKKFGQTIPFGPFLALGCILTIFWGREIVDWYFNLNTYLPEYIRQLQNLI